MKQTLKRLLPKRIRALAELARSVEFWERGTIFRLSFLRLLGIHRTDRLPTVMRPNPLVIFICRGNIYRSSMAAALFARELRKYAPGLARVCSAGLRATLGRPAPEDAIAAAAEVGIALQSHRAQPLTPKLVREADLLVVMDRQNEVVLLTRYPEAAGRTVLLGEFDPSEASRSPEIMDPFGHGLDAVRTCYGRVAVACERLAHSIRQQSELVEPAADPTVRRAVRELLTAPAVLPAFAPLIRHAATIFMMHRFADPELGVTGHDPQMLTRHLRYLRRRGYNLCSLVDLVARLRGGQPPLPRTVVFTIDDAYSDFGRVGAPVFESFECPATVFVVTGFLDRERWMWWDKIAFLIGEEGRGEVGYSIGDHSGVLRWSTIQERSVQTDLLVERLKRVPTPEVESTIRGLETATGRRVPVEAPRRFAPMSWDEVRHWAARGIDFAPHTHTHPILSQTSSVQSAEEIRTSHQRVAKATGKSVPVFAYPNGMEIDFGDRERAAVRQAGLVAAVSAFGGYCTVRHFEADPYSLPRIPYDERKSAFLQVVGGVELFKERARGSLPGVRPA